MMFAPVETIPPMRVDQWLWAARFYKTRSLATQAINGGKVHLCGNRIKPARRQALPAYTAEGPPVQTAITGHA